MRSESIREIETWSLQAILKPLTNLVTSLMVHISLILRFGMRSRCLFSFRFKILVWIVLTRCLIFARSTSFQKTIIVTETTMTFHSLESSAHNVVSFTRYSLQADNQHSLRSEIKSERPNFSSVQQSRTRRHQQRWLVIKKTLQMAGRRRRCANRKFNFPDFDLTSWTLSLWIGFISQPIWKSSTTLYTRSRFG